MQSRRSLEGPPQCYHCNTAAGDTERCPSCHALLMIRGRYQLLAVLGHGGFGIVYKVYDKRLHRYCALEVVSSPSRAEQQQLKTEASILAQHASRLTFLPEIYDIWSQGTDTYLLYVALPRPTRTRNRY